MSSSSRRYIVALLLAILLFGAGALSVFLRKSGQDSEIVTVAKATPAPAASAPEITHAKLSPEKTANTVTVHDTAVAEASFNYAGEPERTKSNVRRINIVIIGIDSRMGANSVKHADANHVLSIIPDSGRIEITSIPRDTYADAGYNDTTGLNKLTLVYANRGVSRYIKEVTRIAGLDKIDYWVEVGFSQAMGIIELFGHKDSKSALQVLRSRQGLGGDDYQRCYNQGQFIRQSILRHFHRLDGMTGDILLRGGLMLVNTNLPYDKADEIFGQLKSKGFPKDSNAVTVRVRPQILPKYKVYDFSKDETYERLKTKIERFNTYRTKNDTSFQTSKKSDVFKKLSSVVAQARSDSAKRPQQVAGKLRPYFEQRAWLQIPDVGQRESIRSSVESLLGSAYDRLKKPEEAAKVRQSMDYERKLFAQPAPAQADKK